MKRVATVASRDLAACVAAIEATEADWIEVRLDALWPKVPGDEAAEHLVALTSLGKPLLATLRPVRQGGAFDGPEDVRISLLLAAARAGFAAVDLENDHPNVAPVVGLFRDESSVVISDHGLSTTPSRDAGLIRLQSMQDLHAEFDKLAVPVGSFMDALRCLELTRAHAERSGRPAIAPLGGGPELRALLSLAGNQATYGHATGMRPAVSGQPSLADVDAVLEHWGHPGPSRDWYAVIGDPVQHSLSPRIHNAALRAAGRPERYGALQVPDSMGAIRLLCTVAPRIGLRGASVTSPLKMHAAQATRGDGAVQAIGAANCIRFDAEPVSTNTDATAILRLLGEAKSVGVLGSGGAARAALWAGNQLGVPVTLVCRDAAHGARLAESTGASVVAWNERATATADAWVQATPLGAGDADVPIQGVGLDSSFIELVYKGGPTPSQKLAADAGAQVIDGRRFLLEQARDAYRFWTGAEPPAGAMEAAL